MKILIISTHNQSTYYVHAYETWKKSLEQYNDIMYYGEGYPNFIGWNKTYTEVFSKLNFVPDLEIWCGGKGNTKPQYIDNKKIIKNAEKYSHIPKLILITDFWEIIRDSDLKKYNKREDQLKSMGVVGYITFYSQTKRWLNKVCKTYFRPHIRNKEHIITFPYVYDNSFTKFRDKQYKYDINLQWHYNGYPFRTMVHNKLINNKKYKIFNAKFEHYHDCSGNRDILEKYFNQNNPVDNFANLLNVSRITIADGYTKYITKMRPSWKLDGTDLFNARYPQVLASKSVLFSPIIEATHIEKLEDGIHYVCINENNIEEKINYYLNNTHMLDKIIINANKWAARNCSSEVVGLRLTNELRNVINTNNKYKGQICQDKFVLNLSNFKRKGFFIEIGSNHPEVNNNTYILEKKYNWKGIMIEYNNEWLSLYKKYRNNSCHIIKNAIEIDYKSLLEKCKAPKNIDYLQIDLEVVNGSTLQVLEKFDRDIFDNYKFKVITFEHDCYRDNGKWAKTKSISRNIFKKRGYIRIFSDLNQNKKWQNRLIIFEDWYVHPDLVDKKYIDYLININKRNYKIHNDISTIAYNSIIY